MLSNTPVRCDIPPTKDYTNTKVLTVPSLFLKDRILSPPVLSTKNELLGTVEGETGANVI
jgi:hypothetical protein